MKYFNYVGGTSFSRFWVKNLFTNELEECTEEDFDNIVIRFRNQYEMKYDGANTQLFYEGGELAAKRSR